MSELHFGDYHATHMGLQMEMLLHSCLQVRLWAPSRQQPDTAHKLGFLMETLPFAKMSSFCQIFCWCNSSVMEGETFLAEQRKPISTIVNHLIKKIDMPYSI